MNQNTLNNITIKKEDLLRILKENLEAHNEVFNASTQAYFEALRDELEKKVQTAKDLVKHYQAKVENVTSVNPAEYPAKFSKLMSISSVKPVSYEASYKTALRKIELSVEDTFTLSEQDFDRYVLNDWEWKAQFVSNASFYNSACNVTGSMAIESGLAKFLKTNG